MHKHVFQFFAQSSSFQDIPRKSAENQRFHRCYGLNQGIGGSFFTEGPSLVSAQTRFSVFCLEFQFEGYSKSSRNSPMYFLYGKIQYDGVPRAQLLGYAGRVGGKKFPLKAGKHTQHPAPPLLPSCVCSFVCKVLRVKFCSFVFCQSSARVQYSTEMSNICPRIRQSSMRRRSLVVVVGEISLKRRIAG